MSIRVWAREGATSQLLPPLNIWLTASKFVPMELRDRGHLILVNVMQSWCKNGLRESFVYWHSCDIQIYAKGRV